MRKIANWFTRGAEFIAATMLAAMFVTFLLQIFSRYVLLSPFGWTLEFCLILWIWIVFFGCAFVVRDRDHVRFDILYFVVPNRLRRIFALISLAAIVFGMCWALLPTWDYIDWMKIRKTSTVENPLTGQKIPMRTIFSIYAIFIVAVIVRGGWRFYSIIRYGISDENSILQPESTILPDEKKGGMQ